MEVICLSCPEASAKEGYEIAQEINNTVKGTNWWKPSFLHIFGICSEEENEQLKKCNIVVGYLYISVILPNGKNFTHKQEYYMSAYDIVHQDTNKDFSLYISSFLYNKFSSFKQKAVNEYMKKGYRAPQNEITKYLLNDGRELVMTRGK